MLPDVVAQGTTRSEADVFDLIKSAEDSENYYCLHSVGIERHARKDYAEVDFVVVGPAGIFCLEVKGGQVLRKDGQWEIGWPGNTYTSAEGPFKQAQGTRWPLAKEVGKRLGMNLRRNAVIGWGVVFPDIIFKENDFEGSKEVVFDQRDRPNSFIKFIERLENYARRRISETGNTQPGKLGPNRIKKIIDCLRGDFDVVVSLKGLISESERELIALSADQYQVLDFALHDDNPRILCEGAAGTGKTLIALEAARRLSSQSNRVLFLCFNENLAEFLKNEVTAIGSGAFVSTVYGYLGEIIRKGGFSQQLSDAHRKLKGADLFLTAYPALFDEAATELMSLENFPVFDVLIVDEGQDILNAPIMNCLHLLLDGGLSEGNWIIFLDGKLQSDVYGRKEQKVQQHLLSFQPSTLLLRENYRNPKAIVAEMCALTNTSEPICKRNLVSHVDYRCFDNEKMQGKKLRALLVELLHEGVSPERITILSTREKQESLVFRQPPDVGKPIRFLDRSETETSENTITATSVSAFKGLENEVIILTDLPDLDSLSSWERSILYVGMTRARTRLYAIVSELFISTRSREWAFN